jgi:hypothetical protein
MAHGDTGSIDPVLVEQVDGRLAIEVQVVVTYVNDAERAEGATVSVVATRADGTTTAPVTLDAASAPGAYVGVVDVPSPGEWTVRIDATSPTATLEVSAVPVSEVAASTSTTTVAVTETAPDPVLPDDDDGAIWGGVAVVGLLVAAGVAVGFGLSRRRSR